MEAVIAERVVRIIITGNSAGAVRAMGQLGSATSAAEGRLRRVGYRTQELGRMMTRLSFPLLAVGGYAIKSAVDFQSAMERIHTQAGARQRDIAGLSRGVLNMAENMKSTEGPTALANALYHLESVGLRGKSALRALQLAADETAVSGSNLEDTATALGGAWSVNIKGAGSLRHIMALLNATAGIGNLRFQDLTFALGRNLLPAAQAAGLSIQDALAAVATFTDMGTPASSAAAQLATSLHYLYHPTATADKALRSIGLTGSQLGADMRKPKGLLTAMRDLQQHLQGMSKNDQAQVLATILPGGRGRILLALMNQLDRYQRKLGQLDSGTKHFTGDVAAAHQTMSYKLHAAWASIQASLVNFGGTLLPIVAKLLPKLTKGIKDVVHWFSGLPKPVKTVLVYFTLFLAIGGPILIFVGSLITALSVLTPIILGVGAALVALAADPITLGLIAIGAAVALIVTHFKQIKSFFVHEWHKLGPILAAPFQNFIGTIKLAIMFVKSLIGLASDFIHGGPAGSKKGRAALAHAAHARGSVTAFGRPVPLSAVRHHQMGGIVEGRMGTIDSVPSWLTPGEGVLSHTGMHALEALNRGQWGGGGTMRMEQPIVVKLDSRVLAHQIVRYTLSRAARGPSSLSGGALVTGTAGSIDVG